MCVVHVDHGVEGSNLQCKQSAETLNIDKVIKKVYHQTTLKGSAKSFHITYYNLTITTNIHELDIRFCKLLYVAFS